MDNHIIQMGQGSWAVSVNCSTSKGNKQIQSRAPVDDVDICFP